MFTSFSYFVLYIFRIDSDILLDHFNFKQLVFFNTWSIALLLKNNATSVLLYIK